MRFIFLINLLIRQSCAGGSVGQSGQGGWGDHDDRGGQGWRQGGPMGWEGSLEGPGGHRGGQGGGG